MYESAIWVAFRGHDLVFAPHVFGPRAGMTCIAGDAQLGAGQTSLTLHVFSEPLLQNVISKTEVLPIWQSQGSGENCRSFYNLSFASSFSHFFCISICQASHWRPAQIQAEKEQISYKSHSQWTEWKLLSCVWLFVTPWTLWYMELSRPEYRTGYPIPSPADLPNPGIELGSPALQADSLPTELSWKPKWTEYLFLCLSQPGLVL